jgi:transposase-like protein
MNLHANAALTLRQRRRMVRLVVEEGWSSARAAAEFGTSQRTCCKWVAHYREASEAGLLDRSSACVVIANRTCERRIEAVAALRRLRFSGPEIAELLEMPVSTVRGSFSGSGSAGSAGSGGSRPSAMSVSARAS